MEASELDNLVRGVETYFRQKYHEAAMDVVWDELLAFPLAAAQAVSRRLLLERHAVPTQAPTLGELIRLLQQEQQRMSRQVEDSGEQQKRNPAHVQRQRMSWDKQFSPYSRDRLRLLQSIPWGTNRTNEVIRTGLTDLIRKYPERTDEIQRELEVL